MNSGFFLATFWGHGSFWHHLATFWGCSGLVSQPLHASSLQGNRSSIISMVWFCFRYHFCCTFFKACLLKTHIFLGRRLAPSVNPFSFPSAPLERASPAKQSESVAWSRPRRRRGPKTTSEALSVRLFWLNTNWDLPVLCNIASTIVLSFCWQLRFLSVLGDFGMAL